MQSVLTKLRRLHEEVCHCWRKQSEPHISDGEAEVLNLGFMLLQLLVSERAECVIDYGKVNKVIESSILSYRNRVHAQFAENSEIHVTEVKRDE